VITALRGSFLFVLVFYGALMWAANPFTPPESVQHYSALRYQKIAGGLPAYKMFVTRSGEGYALLDNEFVKVGGVYDQMKVISVTHEKVVLMTAHHEKKVIVIQSLLSK
jgi:hypothetical protein